MSASKLFRRVRHVHMVGIAGAGMSGIAEVLLNMDFVVSGSDLTFVGCDQSSGETRSDNSGRTLGREYCGLGRGGVLLRRAT